MERAHAIARERGVCRAAYWLVRLVIQPFFAVYFRLRRIGMEHIPKQGPVLLAANHRSFVDPFMIGLCLRRPIHFVAKAELFDKRWKARILLALGAFPICRGESDEQAMETARLILERGGAVGIFPEGTRVRPGPLGEPKRGVGRLALETGAPVVPVSILGTEDIRRGWRIHPRKVHIRCGRALTFPRPLEQPITPNLAEEVTARIWPCIQLQWEWLGGMPPIRSAVVVGAGSWGTAVAVILARAGVVVQLGCRTEEQAAELESKRRNERYLPEVRLPEAVTPKSLDDLSLEGTDLVCLAGPSRALPEMAALIGPALPPRAGVLVLSKGLVAPLAELPCDYLAARMPAGGPVAFLGGPAHAHEATAGAAGLVVAAAHPSFRAQLVRSFRRAGLRCEGSGDAVGVQLAACAKNAAALAAAATLPGGPNAAGAVAGDVYGECWSLARARGASPDSFIGLGGTGDLLATILASHSRNRRAGELLAQGVSAETIEDSLGQTAEALDTVPLLARAMREAGIEAPAVTELGARIRSERLDDSSRAKGLRAAGARVA